MEPYKPPNQHKLTIKAPVYLLFEQPFKSVTPYIKINFCSMENQSFLDRMKHLNPFINKRSIDGEPTNENAQGKKLKQPNRVGNCFSFRGSTIDYMSIPTVNRCVNLLATRLFSLGLRHEQFNGSTWELSGSNINYLLSVEPDSCCSAPVFFRSVVIDYLINGEAFIIPIKVRGLISRLVYIPSHRVQYNFESNTYSVNYEKAKIHANYKESEILHIVNIAYETEYEKTFRGRGFAAFAQSTARVNVECDQKTLDQFSIPDIIAKLKADSPNKFSIDAMNEAGQALQNNLGIAASVVLQPQQTSYEFIPVVNGKTNTIEIKKLAIHDICRFFNVPPAYAFDDGATNYKESTQASYQMAEAVLPVAQSFEAEFNRKLIPFDMRGKCRFHFNMQESYANADPNSVADYFLKALQAGILTPNEIRKACNRPPVVGGDELFISANLTTPDALAKKVHSEAGLEIDQNNNI